jgi:NAD(P)H-hydrate epimerase
MHPLPAGLYTAAQVRELDRRAIEHGGIPGYELMTRAGHATLNALRLRWPEARSLAVCCGPGNNGGDGYVLARIARAQGWRVHAIAIAIPAELQGDARRACEEFVAAGGSCEPWQPQLLAAVDVVVDAVLGTGLSRNVTGLAATCIEAINAAGRPVVAVDLPSGLHADTGHVLGCAVRADLTVTFIGRKVGCHVGAGPDHAGTIVFDGLGVATVDFEQEPVLRLLDESVVAAALPRRARTAHKGRHGHVLVIGGAAGMGGAVRLAGEAALRAGAGLVTVATDARSLQALAARPELMSHVLAGADDLGALIERATVIAVGPGLGQSPWAQDLLGVALAAQKPMVVDADALNLLALAPARRRAHWVLTPHPGEAARLLGTTVAEVQADRRAAARELQNRYGGAVVLKGAGSIVQDEHGPGWLCDRGNPGMAAAGMGDVLTGVIAGIAAQGSDLALAARAGVFVHADAGDHAATGAGERGLLASDVIEHLRACVNR